ncbi:NmrA-like family [Geosmithia morbida]|uniref:NmrA-like family n=1 Tax=Geosmithia morbida TaxID=1094350 RepID=A0A9P4YRF0_9HYPO|nr:NmrA-like family [Geosmithia morbida]KAF4120328.1 NmrA-like family [Geosmithia morbida]
MSSTVLIVGATGSTGRGAIKTISALLTADKSPLPGHKIIAVTRSASGAVAKEIAKLPGVTVIEKDWIGTTPEWLREHNVKRIYLASSVTATHFVDESGMYASALAAGVEYVVRVSTGRPMVRPDSLAFYPRNHWAIERVLESPEFESLPSSSIHPPAFGNMYLASAAEYIKETRKTGKQPAELRLAIDEHAPHAIIDPAEVGAFGAHLLVSEDPSSTKSHYVVTGPVDVNGRDVVDIVEKHIGAKVGNVVFRDTSFFDNMAAYSPEKIRPYISTVKHSIGPAWEGKLAASTASKEVPAIYAPKRTPNDIIDELLQE